MQVGDVYDELPLHCTPPEMSGCRYLVILTPMRLKEDTTSWRARSLKKRDFQHDRGEGVPGAPKPS